MGGGGGGGYWGYGRLMLVMTPRSQGRGQSSPKDPEVLCFMCGDAESHAVYNLAQRLLLETGRTHLAVFTLLYELEEMRLAVL